MLAKGFFVRVGPGAHGRHHRSCEHDQRDMVVPTVAFISLQIMVAHRFRIFKKAHIVPTQRLLTLGWHHIKPAERVGQQLQCLRPDMAPKREPEAP